GQGGAVGNLGAGGGLLGFGGGQLGQFGNLGGQFGFQGGNQSAILIQLIQDVIARGEWSRPVGFVQQQLNQNQGNAAPVGEAAPPRQPARLTALAFSPPAMALVVRATSRIHTNLSSKLGGTGAPAPGGRGMLNGPREGALVFAPRRGDAPK